MSPLTHREEIIEGEIIKGCINCFMTKNQLNHGVRDITLLNTKSCSLTIHYNYLPIAKCLIQHRITCQLFLHAR